MPRKSTPNVIVTNPRAWRLPGGLGTFSTEPEPDPITAKPRQRPGETIHSSERVEVTAERTQRRERLLPSIGAKRGGQL